MWIDWNPLLEQAGADAVVRNVLTAQESERQRIALELHDEVIQSLVVIAQGLDHLVRVAQRGKPDDAANEAKALRLRLVDAITELRLLTYRLRPGVLHEVGLVAAVESLLDEIGSRSGIRGEVKVSGVLPPLADEAQLLLFRIVQEALHNAERHSGTAEVGVTVAVRGDRLVVSVSDSGQGFRVPQNGQVAASGRLGLVGLYERTALLSGKLRIWSKLGRGTRVAVEVPLAAITRRGGRAPLETAGVQRELASDPTE